MLSRFKLRRMEQELSFFSIIEKESWRYKSFKHKKVNKGNLATNWRAWKLLDIIGTAKVNDVTDTVSGEKAFIGKEKKLIYVKCTGTDGNEITLKFSAR